MPQKIEVLVPEETTNLVKNPSFEKDTSGWIPAWEQEATFEDQELTPNPTGFDSLAGTPANLDATAPSAIRGNFGLEVTTNGVGSEAYGELTDPNDESVVTVEFLFNARDIVMANNDAFHILHARGSGIGATTFRIILRFAAGVHTLVPDYRDDAGVVQGITPVTIERATDYLIRFEYKIATAPAANDGIVRFYLNNTLIQSITNADTDTWDVDTLRFGAIQGINAGTLGIFSMDNCRWAKGFVPFTGSSIERTLERARFGRASTKVFTDGNALNEGIYVRVDTSGINARVTATAYVRGEGKLRMRLKDGLTGETKAQSPPVTINDKRWHRLEVSGLAVGGDDFQAYIETAETTQKLIFYADGAQLEEKGYSTVYCDGEQQGCRWNGVANLSISTREAEEMTGGRWEPIRDDECQPDTYVTVIGGFGMPPITINRQSTAQADGSVFDSVKSEERLLQMNVWVKDEGGEKQKRLGLERIKELRQILIDLVKPDNSPDSEAFILRVTENEREFTIACRYEAGLEFDTDVREKWRNSIPLRLLCLDPFWTEDGQEVALLDTENTLTNNSVVFSRVNGQWGLPGLNGFGVNTGATSIIVDPNRRIYFGGNFTVDGDANVLRRFGSFNDDNSQIIERGTGLNSVVNDLAPHPNGRIYVGGAFTADNNGNAMNRIAEYDSDTDILSALGAGLNNQCQAISVSPTGRIYVVGIFTTAGGNAVPGVAYWDGAWQTLGDFDAELGVSTKQDVLAISDDEVYVVGNQVDGGILARWNGSIWEILFKESTAGAVYYSLAEDVDGTILFGGKSANTITNGELRRWNGSAATQLGNDFTNTTVAAAIFAIAVGEDGLIYIVGDFDGGGSGLDYPFPGAIWNGSTFVYFDAEVSVLAGSSLWGLLILPNNDIYVGGNDIPDNTLFASSGIITVQNTSTRDVFPIVTITGTGKIIWLENQTTGQRVYLDYILQEDEELTIDFTQGLKVTSNYRGDVPDAVLPNSDDFFLAAGNLNEPKDNIIAVFMVDEVDPVVQLRYVPTHWSIDAAAT